MRPGGRGCQYLSRGFSLMETGGGAENRSPAAHAAPCLCLTARPAGSLEETPHQPPVQCCVPEQRRWEDDGRALGDQPGPPGHLGLQSGLQDLRRAGPVAGGGLWPGGHPLLHGGPHGGGAPLPQAPLLTLLRSPAFRSESNLNGPQSVVPAPAWDVSWRLKTSHRPVRIGGRVPAPGQEVARFHAMPHTLFPTQPDKCGSGLACRKGPSRVWDPGFPSHSKKGILAPISWPGPPAVCCSVVTPEVPP